MVCQNRVAAVRPNTRLHRPYTRLIGICPQNLPAFAL
jgi:rRNA pseudouridine-1189 N-methylase Emg1 (Nep1/Mra1 family)